jgi:hypothetical protein
MIIYQLEFFAYRFALKSLLIKPQDSHFLYRNPRWLVEDAPDGLCLSQPAALRTGLKLLYVPPRTRD